MTDYGRQTGQQQIEFQRTFDAPIEKVWQFLVDPAKRALWFCGGSTDDEAGGDIVFEFDHRRLAESDPPQKYASEEVATHRGKILEYDPPHRLRFTWFESPDDQSSEVEIALRAVGETRTELHLVHKGVSGFEMLIGVLAGWHGHFDLLNEVLQGDRKTDFWVRDQQLEAEYEKMV